MRSENANTSLMVGRRSQARLSHPTMPSTNLTHRRGPTSMTEAEIPSPTDRPTDPFPWSAFEILVVVALVFLVWPVVTAQLFRSFGVFEKVYGPDAVKLAEDKLTDSERARLEAELGSKANLDNHRIITKARLTMILSVSMFPLQLLTVPLVLRRLRNVPPEKLGLTTQRSHEALRAGMRTWATYTPLVLLLNAGVVLAWKSIAKSQLDEHPLALLAGSPLTPFEWILVVFTACVTAPAIEELVFRGLLQPFFCSFRDGPMLALAFAGAIALVTKADALLRVFAEPSLALAALAPFAFVLAVAPLVYFCRDRPEIAGVIATSILFASVHSFAWPSPVGLFVLAIGLGFVYQRTESLLAPFLVHSLFNGVSCALLVMA